MKVSVTSISIPSMSTIGFGKGRRVSDGAEVAWFGDHRPMRDIGEAMRDGDEVIAQVEATSLTACPPARLHWHVHSHIGGGYLCECDRHYPLSAKGRDQALREERDFWRDYADDSNGRTIRISGSVRSRHFTIDDPASLGWARYVDAWSCHDWECNEEEDYY